MIIRTWLIAGGALVVIAWVLTVPYSPHPFQGSVSSTIEDYRVRGLIPEPGQLVMSKAVGHDVFEVPETDALHAREAAAAMGSMPGMNMSESSEHAAGTPDNEPAHGEQPMAPMPMHESGEQPMAPMPMHGSGEQPMAPMPMQGGGGQPMAPMPMQGSGGQPMAPMPIEGSVAHGESALSESGMDSMRGHGMQSTTPGMAMPGMDMAEGGQAGGHGGGGGLSQLAPGTPMAAAARTVRIEMSEWGFSPASLDVKHGESVRLVVHNVGNMPHEFMLMTHAGMGAVNYRLQRADWNLLEHEAIYERELVLPGDEIEVVLRIDQPGAWMFMCMFPYHMQFGMMGVMATEGMSMDMGEMKM